MERVTERVVTLVLCLRDGTMLGSLAPYAVAVPWWQDACSVVRGAGELYGVDVTVLRLLWGEAAGPPGGRVTYLASVDAEPAVSLVPWEGAQIVNHPLRPGYAKPGGPELDLAWADSILEQRGTPRVAAAVQDRTWNLSSLWRLPVAAGAAWLKVVPAFYAHEGEMLARLDPLLVPPLIACDGPRMLLDEVPGEDQYAAAPNRLRRMVRLLVDLQSHWSTRLEDLTDVALPDWRAASFSTRAHDVVARSAQELDVATRRTLESLLEGLSDQFEALAQCGIPDSLVHGDFHPGNFRGDSGRIVLLDWGDCGIGHPLLDQPAFLDRIHPTARPVVTTEWSAAWRTAKPGCEPDRASGLIAPFAALRHAIVYRAFLDRIEPSERVYHARDPADWLARAAALARRANRR